MSKKSAREILEETANLLPEDVRPIFNFKTVGDSIVATFEERRTGIKTKKSDNATAVDVGVLESIVIGGDPIIGPASFWKSLHITQLLDAAQLESGDVFVLRLASIDRKSNFKKFFFKKVTDEVDDGTGGGETGEFNWATGEKREVSGGKS